jgi:hypothetical protein
VRRLRTKLGNQTLRRSSTPKDRINSLSCSITQRTCPAGARATNNIWGDANYDAIFSDWKTVGGVKIGTYALVQLNDMEISG